MKLVINEDRTTVALGTWGTQNENDYEILEFIIPEKFNNYNKRIVYYLDEDKKWDLIENNRVLISNAVTQYERVKAYVWLTKSEEIYLKYVCVGTETGNYYFNYNNQDYYFTMPEIQENDELIFDIATSKLSLNDTEIPTSSIGEGTELEFITEINAAEDFRTKLFEMNFYENENADGIVPTQEEVDGFNSMITAMNNKIDEIDNKIDEVNDFIDDEIEIINSKIAEIDEEVDGKIDEIDNKIIEVDEAIDGVENLNINVSDKVDGDVSVTLTKKNGTTKTVVLSDGTGLMFDWSGTQLGIKTEDEQEYTYVDLQGVQGPIGPKGDAFTIKKTYSSVEAMNADFNNMQLGDYVMIASDVQSEDNAKLYTRGEETWIFISDFSGAQGIKGETGATPNIQIGTVTSGDTSSVTRTGTNENPIFNFVLQKGIDGYTPIKGTDYFTQAEINEFTTTITNNVNQAIGLVVDEINGEVI